MYLVWEDGVPYKMKEPFDFSFLNRFGKVFKVFDDQDSGNICFGVVNDEEKRFVKFAGAPTQRSVITQKEAIARMKNTIQIYKDLSHPILGNCLMSQIKWSVINAKTVSKLLSNSFLNGVQ